MRSMRACFRTSGRTQKSYRKWKRRTIPWPICPGISPGMPRFRYTMTATSNSFPVRRMPWRRRKRRFERRKNSSSWSIMPLRMPNPLRKSRRFSRKRRPKDWMCEFSTTISAASLSSTRTLSGRCVPAESSAGYSTPSCRC